MNIEAITAAMLRIAAERGPEKSMCPTDVARAGSTVKSCARANPSALMK